jgi:hypothetical protein
VRRVLDYRRIGRRRWYVAIVLLNPAILVGSYEVMRLLMRPLLDRTSRCWRRQDAGPVPAEPRQGSSAPGELE